MVNTLSALYSEKDAKISIMENSNTENKHSPNILTIHDNDALFNVENLIIYNSDKWKF